MRRRNALAPFAAIVAFLVIAFVIFTNVWTDRLWFISFGFGEVFSTMLWTRLALFAGFALLMALVVVGNLLVARRLRPRSAPRGSGSELLDRYRSTLDKRFVPIAVAVGAVLGLFAGGAGSGQVMTYQAWRNSTPFGQTDPQFGLDISFFVFEYPWWQFVLSFAFYALLLSAAGSMIIYLVAGALRLTEPGKGRRRFTSKAAQAHLSVLLGLALLIKAGDYWLDQYGLAISDSGLLTGMTYTSTHASLNALRVLAGIAVLCALMFLANAVLTQWAVPLVGLVLMVLSGIILQGLYPAAMQGISVNPDEPQKERPYIERNIAATRAAYGVEGTEVTSYSAETDVSAGQLRADAEALPGIRLMDPAVIAPAYEQSQQVRGYYSFPQLLDVDRYTIDGDETDAVVAVREMDLGGLDQPSWNNLHTVYTHGYGLVAAYGNRKGPGGEPEWIVKDIPPTGKLAEHEPRIYFGELHDDYSIVGGPAGTSPTELDTPGRDDGEGPRYYTYTGKGGVPIGNPLNQVAFAAKFADVNILLSDRVNAESKIIHGRTPKERVEAAAPWMTADSNAYPAVVEGRIVWIVDGYTTSNSYPNSQRVSLQDSTTDSQSETGTVGIQQDTKINYIRNSVKAVVDAYDGTVSLYEWDEADPVLKTWQKVFPGSVKPKSEISDDLLNHLRYPSDLFKVQRAILGRYHVTDPNNWYLESDLWRVPQDPVAVNRAGSAAQETPFYLSIKWPGDEKPIFSQTSTYVPNGRQNLAGYLAVNADASDPNYGRLRILRMSDSSQIDGPGQTFNALVNDRAVAERLRPYLNQGAAQARYGNLLTLPVGGGLLYVQPIYTMREGTSGAFPGLQFVVVRFGDHIGIGNTLQEALDQVFAGDAGANTGEDGEPSAPTGEPDNPAATRALQQAQQAFTEADEALKNGDLATYQAKLKEAQEKVEEAMQAMGQR
ncbi:UPF0182 family protein [Propionibacteriaceae bacterium Y1700]|uniref:UPF0182 family membrane protein n=1 Tax=Microlunatus sp. Y1700 TaxID=3418487 RepID=UPI003DA6F204